MNLHINFFPCFSDCRFLKRIIVVFMATTRNGPLLIARTMMDRPLSEDNPNMSFLVLVPEQHAGTSVWLGFPQFRRIFSFELYDSFWSGTLDFNIFPKERGVLWA